MAIDNPMFSNLSDTEKLVVLLNPSNINQVKKNRFLYKTVFRAEDRGLLVSFTCMYIDMCVFNSVILLLLLL